MNCGEGSVMFLMLIILMLPSLLFGFICYKFAEKKNRKSMGWFFCGFFLWGIGIIVVLIAEEVDGKDEGVSCSDPLHLFSSSPTPMVADEIRKLRELRDAGVLTQEEFEVRKNKLLKK